MLLCIRIAFYNIQKISGLNDKSSDTSMKKLLESIPRIYDALWSAYKGADRIVIHKKYNIIEKTTKIYM